MNRETSETVVVVSAAQHIRLWRQVVERAGGEPVTVAHVCAVAISVTGVDGAAVAVALDATPRELHYASGPIALALEELTMTIGEGPFVDAFAGELTLVADLSAPECLTRWPVFASAATRAGAGAVFALPLRIGGIRLGCLALHRATTGDLDRAGLSDALVLTDTVRALLLSPGLSDRSYPDGRWHHEVDLQYPEVHQATGMLAVQLGVSARVALVRLRAYAYAHDRRLREVANEVVARRLRLASDGDPPPAQRRVGR